MKEQNKIEEILNSLHGIERAEPKPFMYTRIMAKMQKEESNFWAKTGSFIAKPAIAVFCLVAVLATNLYVVLGDEQRSDAPTITASADSDILTNENFILAANNDYDFNK